MNILSGRFWFVMGFFIMLSGLVHTMVTCSQPLTPVSHRFITPEVKVPETVTVSDNRTQYSSRTVLLAQLIKERFGNSSYSQDLLIASCVNKDTAGLTWPTPLAVASIIEIESQYNPAAVSNCGAKGLMQISPVWSQQVPPSAYYSIPENIKYGIKILNAYYRRYDGNRMAAILSYNSGDHAYNAGKAWPTYWWRFKDAKLAFDTLYQHAV